MSLKFDEALNIVAEKILEAPKPKYQTYSQDAAEISAKMDQELISINSIFKGTVSNWDETTALYKAEFPKLDNPFLLLKMPFTVEPQRVFVSSSDDGVPVNLKTSVNHPAVENGYLNGEKLIQMFIWDLNRVLDRIPKITCSSGKVYKLSSSSEIWNCVKMIEIQAMENDSEQVPSILYSFIPTFIFTKKSFYYINASNFFYQRKESVTIAYIKKTSQESRNVNLLVKTLANQSTEILPISVLMILDSLKNETGIGSLLLEAIQLCIPHLQNPGPLINAYGKLMQFKQSDSVQLTELKEVFGLK